MQNNNKIKDVTSVLINWWDYLTLKSAVFNVDFKVLYTPPNTRLVAFLILPRLVRNIN